MPTITSDPDVVRRAVRVVVTDGKHHPVDSKEVAFATAGREAFLAAVKTTKSLDLGGFTVSFGDQDHQGSDTVYLTQFVGGKVEPIADSNLAIVEVK